MSKQFRIYQHVNKDNECIYVGLTTNMRNRQRDHKNNKPWFTEVATILEADAKNKTTMDMYEKYYINKLNPKYNKKDKRGDDVSGLKGLEELLFIEWEEHTLSLNSFKKPEKYNKYKEENNKEKNFLYENIPYITASEGFYCEKEKTTILNNYKCPVIWNIRGRGLMCGCDIKNPTPEEMFLDFIREFFQTIMYKTKNISYKNEELRITFKSNIDEDIESMFLSTHWLIRHSEYLFEWRSSKEGTYSIVMDGVLKRAKKHLSKNSFAHLYGYLNALIKKGKNNGTEEFKLSNGESVYFRDRNTSKKYATGVTVTTNDNTSLLCIGQITSFAGGYNTFVMQDTEGITNVWTRAELVKGERHK